MAKGILFVVATCVVLTYATQDVEKIAASNWRDPCVLLAAPTAWLSWYASSP